MNQQHHFADTLMLQILETHFHSKLTHPLLLGIVVKMLGRKALQASSSYFCAACQPSTIANKLRVTAWGRLICIASPDLLQTRACYMLTKTDQASYQIHTSLENI